MTIEDILQYVSVASIIGSGLYWAVLSPLKEQISRLSDTIDRINTDIDKEQADMRELDARLTRVEQSDKSAHKRISLLEEKVLLKDNDG